MRSLTTKVRWSRLNGSPCAVRNTVKSSGSTASCGRAFADVLLEPQHGPRSDRHIAVLAALALVDQDQAAVE